MADLKITALPALVEAGVQAVDVLALADLSATETKKVTVKDLVAAGVALIDDGDIPAAKVGTLGTNQVATAAIVDGAVTNVKLANSSISLGGISIALGATDATPAFNLADATGYTTANLSGTITNAQLAGSIAGTKLSDTTITYAKLNLSDGDIPGAKIATGGITATQLAANSVTASELADDAVDTAAIADGAVVAASIATDTITSNQIAANAIGASELADNAVDAGAIAADAVTTVKILDANVTAAKLAADLPGTILATGAIGSTQLAANSVTASELADNAVDSGAIADSAVIDAKIASGIGGAKITDGTITAAKLATANIDRSLNVASGNLGINNTVVAATRSGITYNAQGLITGTVALAASDLPLATTSAVGGVSVGTGLAVTGAGALSLSNSVTAATISGITYNAQGQITATTGLVAGDLPAATTSAKGAVLITSGGGISVDGSGAISTSTSGITAGTYTKVTVNNKGVATAGTSLVAGDIPSLAATKITSGTFDVGRFGTNTILGSKFADSSVCQFTGAQSTSGVVTFPTAEFKGQFFYDLTNDDLYVYDGSAFQPVTITSGEIIYAGNYRADTNKITSLTAAGTAQGYTVNAALQAASAANNRYYFVCDKSGTGTSPAPTVTINPPDMILSNGSTYEKLDISNFIAGQVASNIGVTATGGIQNTNVQSVLEELDTEKLNTTGGTLTGNLALNQSSSIIFEGATPNDFESTLTVIDPTADRTLSLPNVTGTLVSTGDTGTVTSTMIVDGTILNADINASAAIALTKLANVTATHIIVGNASNVPTAVAITGDISISNAGLVAITADSIVNADIKSDAAISGSKIVAGTTSVVGVVQLTDSAASSSTTTAATPAAVKVAKDAADAAATTANAALPTTGGTLTNNLIIDNAKQIRFAEADSNGANFVSLQAPDTLAADVSYTLPSAAPTASGQVLASTTGGVLSWTDDPTGQWVTSGSDLHYDGGNVGIGVDPSTFSLGKALQIQGAGVGVWGENTSTVHLFSNAYYDGGYKYGVTAPAGQYQIFQNSHLWGIADSGNADAALTWTQAMKIDSSGRLLVGTNTEGYSAGDDLTIESTSHTGITLRSPTDKEGAIYFSDGTSGASEYGGIVMYSHTADALKLYSGTLLALTLDSSQNATFAGDINVESIHTDYRIGIGAAAADFGSGVSTLLLQGRSSTKAGCIDFKEYSSGTRLANIFVQNDATYGMSIGTSCSGEAGDFIRFHTNALGTEALRLDANQKATFANDIAARSIELTSGVKVASHPVVGYDSYSGSYATRLGSTGTSTLRYTQIYAGGGEIATFDGVTKDVEVVGNLKTNNLSGRNLIINGDFQIAQRATTNDTAGAQSTYHTLDRWLTQIQAGTITESQQSLSASDTGPWEKGLRHYMRILNNGPIGAGSTQYAEMDQRIEAQTVAQSGWDYDDSAKYITLSFWLRASVTQSYVVVLYSQDGTQRHYPFEVALSANTWTKVTKSIPGNSGITVNNDRGSGLALSFIAAYGTSWTSSNGSFDTWNTTGNGLNRFPDMTTTWATTANATFDLTGVQLELGSIATEFEHKSYGESLASCHRYYYKMQNDHTYGQYFAWVSYGNTDQRSQTIYFPQSMRATPSFSYETTMTNYVNLGLGGAVSAFYKSDSGSNNESTGLRITTADTITSGMSGILRGNNTTAGYFVFDSEI